MAVRQKNLLTAALAAAWLASVGPAWAQPAGASPGERAAWDFRPNVVHITADGFPDDDTESGYGFIVGERDNQLIIATADHVVRRDDAPAGNIHVTFFGGLGDNRSATLLARRLPPAGGDLAVLETPIPPGLHPHWPATVQSYTLQPGDHAWRIGKGDRWVPPSVPGSFQGRADALWLEYDNLDTPRGSSGGPILGESGLIGMVVRDGGLSGASARVLPADTIGSMLRTWDLPWQLSGPERPAVAAAPPQPPAPPVAPVASTMRGPAPVLSRAMMEQASRQVLAQLLAASADDSATASASFDRLYGAVVVYNGQRLRHDAVLQAKSAFAEEWPRRRYLPRPGSTYECSVVIATCEVETTIEWLRGSAFVGQFTGQSHLTLSIDFSAGSPKIIAETGPPDRR